jgi:ubiquinone/menaquinone biosynthesis C-methylase UbiE
VTGPTRPADHFSSVSVAYSAFRPRYPRELIEFFASLAPRHRIAWDCGAGSGQAASDIAKHFEFVAGTDLSVEQLAKAPKGESLGWAASSAEAACLKSGCVDAIAVAQALHWFSHEAFYAEVRRVASSPGVPIVAWTYAAPIMEGDVGVVLKRFMYEDVGPYWPRERVYVDNEYRTIAFPFERIPTPAFSLEEERTLGQIAGYMSSMSATARYIKANGTDPVVAVHAELKSLWPDESPRRIVWPVIMLAGRIP